MPETSKRERVERSLIRREKDRSVREQIKKHKILFELGQIITSEMYLDSLFDVIMEQTNRVMGTERCSVFMYDAKEDQLWSLVSTDLKRNEIRIPSSYGVAGWVFQNKEPLIINDAYSDPRFFPKVDQKTGFKTRNILCIPLINREKQCVGTLQTLNKKSGTFSEEDRELLISASHYITISLENAKLYEDLKLLDKAKERVINHLSHELKTPLAIISTVLTTIHKKLKDRNIQGFGKAIDRAQRNLQRLTDLQEKIDDILNQRYMDERAHNLDMIGGTADLAEHDPRIFEAICEPPVPLSETEDAHREIIQVGAFLKDLYERAMFFIRGRALNIGLEIDEDMHLYMDRMVLDKVAEGLLRNAIENTPDEGRIDIIAKREKGEIRITFHDFGVGITEENQKMIFGGFFHTQDTAFYSSKLPYEFNAGGSGSDLLRTKCFSERYDFAVEFESRRCKYIPGDRDLCPGRISRCQFIHKKSECWASGKSIFSIRFPEEKFTKPK